MQELTAMTFWRFILCTLAFCCGAHAQPVSGARIRSLLPQSFAYQLLFLKPPTSSGSLLPQGQAPTQTQGSFDRGQLIRSDPRLGSGFTHPLLDPNYGNSQFSGVGGYSETLSPTGFPDSLSGSGAFADTSGMSSGFSGSNSLGLPGIDSGGFPGSLMTSGGLLGDMTSAGNAGLTLEQLSGGFGQGAVGDIFASGQNGGLLGLDLTPGAFPGGSDILAGQSESSPGFDLSMGLPGDFSGTEQQNVNNGLGMNIYPERIPTSPPQIQMVPTKPPMTNTGQLQGRTSIMPAVDRKQIQNNVRTLPKKMPPTSPDSRQNPTGQVPTGQHLGSAVVGIVNGQVPNRPAPIGVGPPIIRKGTILPPSAVLPDGGIVQNVDGNDATIGSPGGIETTVDGTDISYESAV